jgi:peptidoglycan/LPS O-acetylase OafA/YrhL
VNGCRPMLGTFLATTFRPRGNCGTLPANPLEQEFFPLSTTATRSSRIDFLRGVAIFSVLLLHFSLTYDLVHSPLAALFPANWIAAAVDNGNYGVTMFFVISGCLITSNNLIRYGQLRAVNLRQFYAFRFARIIPPLLLALLIIVPLGLLGVPSFSNSDGGHALPTSFFVIATLSVLTFWHNVLMQQVGWFNYCLNIYWSLSVEEVFYLTFPLASRFLRRNGLIIALCCLFILVAPWYRASHLDDEISSECGYLACFDAIAIGCLVALLNRRVTLGRGLGTAVRVVASAILITTYFMGIEGHEVFGFTVVALCTGVLLIRACDAPDEKLRSLPVRLVCAMGRQSYEIYLFHGILLATLRNIVHKGAMAYAWKLPVFALFVIASALLAGLIAKYYAEVSNAWLRRAFWARDPAPT